MTLSMHQLGSLGQATSECGPKPGLGPGELSMCCPELGWVVYDQYESPYALCERASAQAAGKPADTAAPSGDYADQVAARRAAHDAEMSAKRAALDAKRAALEERRFQQQVQTTLLKAQLQKAAAARAASPEAVAARAAASRASTAAAKARKAEQTKKAVTYGALALAAVKIFGLF